MTVDDHIVDPDKLGEDEFYRTAFSRNIGILSPSDQERLRGARVAIAGLGGSGSSVALNLPRFGVGAFTISDIDSFGVENFNRQLAANINTVGRPKIDVTAEFIKSINPYVDIKKIPQGINNETIDEFLKDVDVVIDALDFFAMETRRLLCKRAHEKGIFLLSSGPIGFGSLVYVIDPKGVDFDTFFDMRDDMPDSEMAVNLAIGMLPKMLQKDYFTLGKVKFGAKKAPSLVSGALAVGNLVTTETVKILLDRETRALPYLSQFDPYVQKYALIKLRRGNRGFLQRLKLYIVKKKIAKREAGSNGD